MNHETLKSETYYSPKAITVKPSFTLHQYKEIVYLTKEYQKSLQRGLPLPKQPLPDLSVLLDASVVVNAYMQNVNLGLNLKLYNACLDAETIVAIWCFANHTTLNITLGDYQLFSVKTE